jgi:2-polyprenyl-6-hydroxyphenyl methylase / 3-demethylubiquinone-9 3-methyltransferase
MTPVDNELYDRFAATWWDEDENLALLRTGMNPARFTYMCRVLVEELAVEPRGKRCLDVGCGGGLLAEEFAKLGCRVTGVDVSERSLETARAHARQERLEIAYVPAPGEDLPFEDKTFDFVYCCDVLEHVQSVERAVAEAGAGIEAGWRVPVRHDQPHAPQPARLHRAVSGMGCHALHGTRRARLGHVHQAAGARGDPAPPRA